MTELILLAVFLALGWLWWDSMQAREAASWWLNWKA